MESLDDSGYLSPSITEWIGKHRASNFAWFDLVERVNRVCQRLMLSLEPPTSDEQRVYVAILFSRVLSHCQGLVLLSERGMVTETQSLLRSMLEVTFATVAIAKHSNVAAEYRLDDLHQRKKCIESFKQLPLELRQFHRLDTVDLEKLSDDLKREIDTKKVKRLTTEYLAQKADMLNHYKTLYVLLSGSTHARIADVVRALEVDEQSEIQGLKWGPDVDGISDLLGPVCDWLFISARNVSTLFANDKYDKELQDCWEEYESLWNSRSL